MTKSDIIKDLIKNLKVPVIEIKMSIVSVLDLFGKTDFYLSDHERQLLDLWYSDRVAKFEGATSTVRDLYEDSLVVFVKREAKETVHIDEGVMLDYLKGKGVTIRSINGKKVFQGIKPIIGGSIRSGNYMT